MGVNFSGLLAVGKVNLRLNKPSSHTRLWSRLAILDVAWGGVSPLAAYLLRDGTVFYPKSVGIYCGIALLASVLVFQWYQTSSPIARFYSIRDALQLLKACFLITAISAVASFLLTRLEEAPRSIPVLQFLVLASGLVGARMLLRLRDTHREIRTKNTQADKAEHVIIVQGTRLAWFFSKMLEELAAGEYQIVAVLDERPSLKHRSLNGYPIIGVPADLERVVADYAIHGVHIDKLIIAARPHELTRSAWDEVCRVCRMSKITIEILPELLMLKGASYVQDNTVIPPEDAVLPTQSSALRLDRPFWRLKRVFDVTTALIVVIVLSPIAVIVTVLVLLDVGAPVVFWQQRIGRNGALFHLYKFRSLHTLFDRLTKQRREAQQPSPFGQFLQKTRLDELPQLWNVLRGDMSLIGPRPLLLADQPTDARVRLLVRPGLTGWAQVCGGKIISTEEKSALDEWYIQHASFLLDLKIMIRTISMLLVGDCRDDKAIAIALANSLGETPVPLAVTEPERVSRADSRVQHAGAG